MSKLIIASVGLVAVVGLAALAPSATRAALQVGHDDEVHYVVHLLAGRVFSLCPCGTTLAEHQYARGMYHARTPRQQALLTTARPTTLREQVRETPGLVSALLRHVVG